MFHDFIEGIVRIPLESVQFAVLLLFDMLVLLHMHEIKLNNEHQLEQYKRL
jgi:hypothetical protein